jgi:hypothetical protein
MGAIFDEVKAYFSKGQWRFHEVPDKNALQLAVQGKSGRWECFAQAREAQYQFAFYSVCPTNIPEAHRRDVAEFLTRANYGMVIGNFEMDLNDGEVRFKTSIDVENDRLSQALINQLVFANLSMMDRYLPGIMAVAFGASTPEEAIAAVEGGAAGGGRPV